MKNKILGITAATLIFTGGIIYGLNGEKCPLAGITDCPLTNECPLAGTPDCPLLSDNGTKVDCCKK